MASEQPQSVRMDYNNESDGTSYDNQDVSTSGFLHAQTESLRRGFLRPEESDRHMNWEDYVVSSATDCSIAVDLSSDTILEEQVFDICAHLIKIFRNFEKYAKFLSYRDAAAQDLLDLLQKLLDHAPLERHFRVILYVALVRLCRKSELCPRCFSLTNVQVDPPDPLLDGGFGDIYKAHHNGMVVCVKAIKLYQTSDRLTLEKAYSREAVVWGQLSHLNILPFYGVHRLNRSEKFCLVSPWMDNGTIREFLAQRSREPDRSQLDRTPLVFDVASGMKYLHDNGVVHGDLKSLNILVTQFEHACLADFGLSSVSESSGLVGPALSSRQAEGGTKGFQAPELTPELEYPELPESKVEKDKRERCIFTGEIPFAADRQKTIAIALKINRGERPKRPTSKVHVQRGLTDMMWALMEKCWSQSADDRPTAARILQALPPLEANLQAKKWEWTHARRPGFETFDGKVDATITSALSHLQPLL